MLLVVAVALLGISFFRTYKVYDAETDDDFGILTFTKTGERQMVIDTTFSGVDRREGRLYSTYDRLAEHGKRSCPT